MTAPVGASSTGAPWKVRWALKGLVILVVLAAPITAANVARSAWHNLGVGICHLSPSACQGDQLDPKLPVPSTVLPSTGGRAVSVVTTTPDYGPSYTGLRSP
jgi:hypothetical protein